MNLRAILVPVTGHKADEATLTVAEFLAAAFGAQITALCPKPDASDLAAYVADWSSPEMANAVIDAAEDNFESQHRDAKRLFDGWMARAQRSPYMAAKLHWREQVGAPAALLAIAAKFADLVVMRGLGPEGPVDGDAMLEAVLFDAGRPVLLCPPVAPADLFGPAVVAWAGGREEAHAISAALPILGRARSVAIHTIGPAGVETEPLLDYLSAHGVTAIVGGSNPEGRSVAEALSAEARGIGASLVVMGAYHHSRTHELVFGGTTRQMIGHIEVPVLLAH